MAQLAPAAHHIGTGPRPREDEPYLEFRDLSKIYGADDGPVRALDGISIGQRKREFLSILGPSGCGKSTLIQIVGGLEPATSGSVRVAVPGQGTVSRRLGTDSVMVWQSLNLFPWRSVLDNVAFGPEMAGMPKAERHERARALIASVGLSGFEHYRPGQ